MSHCGARSVSRIRFDFRDEGPEMTVGWHLVKNDIGFDSGTLMPFGLAGALQGDE